MHLAAFKSCREAARKRKEQNIDWLSDNELDGFREWNRMSVEEQISLMATYAPDCTSPDVAVHIVDAWKKTVPKVSKRSIIDKDGWEVVQNQFSAQKTDDEKGDDTVEADNTVDADVLFERLRRDLDIFDEDDDEDYDESDPVFENQRLNDMGTADLVNNTPINIQKIPEKLKQIVRQSTFSNIGDLSIKERMKLVKCWAELLKLDADANVKRYTLEYKKAASITLRYEALVDTMALRGAAAIGMTTNGAAKYNRYLTV